MLLQSGTPDTFGYLLAGYAVFFGLPLAFIFSLWVRQRNLEKDLEVLQELRRDEAPGPGPRP